MAIGYKKTGSIAPHKANAATSGWAFGALETAPSPICNEPIFHELLVRERRRAERSRNPFLLMLFNADGENRTAREILLEAVAVLAPAVRETDTVGWYDDGEMLGAIFTEFGGHDIGEIRDVLHAKVRGWLQENLDAQTAAKITITVHAFPQVLDPNGKDWSADSKLYPDFHPEAPQKKRLSRAIKRAIDVAASGLLLILLLPVFAVVATIIKLTSKGPVLFRQERMGRFGKRFRFLKFRSMYLNNASTIHKEYVQEFIAGSKSAAKSESAAAPVYKIVNDPRVTPVGRFLRKTSLDELPQLWNVVVGEMSLVGPRPPVPYEYAVYEPWHRRRVLEVQPGITGLWQVNGRSRTTFDEMVRLDLQYATTWSLWLDLKILFMTPKAVLTGAGAH